MIDPIKAWIAVLLAWVISGVMMHRIVTKDMRNQAIEANVAEWRIDAKTGGKEFIFIPCKEK